MTRLALVIGGLTLVLASFWIRDSEKKLLACRRELQSTQNSWHIAEKKVRDLQAYANLLEDRAAALLDRCSILERCDRAVRECRRTAKTCSGAISFCEISPQDIDRALEVKEFFR